MAASKRRIRTGLLVLSAVAFALCPVTTAALFQASPARAAQPFQTVQPVQPTFTPPIGTTTPIPTPIPTLGPGQFFDDATRPDTVTTVGDDEFGYGEIAGQPGLYLVWVTDDTGTHYYTVDGNDPQFRGDTRDDDFVDLISAREETLSQIQGVQDRINEHQGARAGYDLGAVGVVGLGIIVCGVVTGGACFVPFAVGGLVLVGNAMSQNGASAALEPSLERLQGDLEQNEANLRGRFEAANP